MANDEDEYTAYMMNDDSREPVWWPMKMNTVSVWWPMKMKMTLYSLWWLDFLLENPTGTSARLYLIRSGRREARHECRKASRRRNTDSAREAACVESFAVVLENMLIGSSHFCLIRFHFWVILSLNNACGFETSFPLGDTTYEYRKSTISLNTRITFATREADTGRHAVLTPTDRTLSAYWWWGVAGTIFSRLFIICYFSSSTNKWNV